MATDGLGCSLENKKINLHDIHEESTSGDGYY